MLLKMECTLAQLCSKHYHHSLHTLQIKYYLHGRLTCFRGNIPGSTTTDCNKLTANNADWLRRPILNMFLLFPEPYCRNPHFVTKSLRQNHCNKTNGSQSVCSQSVCHGQLTWLEHTMLLTRQWHFQSNAQHSSHYLI